MDDHSARSTELSSQPLLSTTIGKRSSSMSLPREIIPLYWVFPGVRSTTLTSISATIGSSSAMRTARQTASSILLTSLVEILRNRSFHARSRTATSRKRSLPRSSQQLKRIGRSSSRKKLKQRQQISLPRSRDSTSQRKRRLRRSYRLSTMISSMFSTKKNPTSSLSVATTTSLSTSFLVQPFQNPRASIQCPTRKTRSSRSGLRRC